MHIKKVFTGLCAVLLLLCLMPTAQAAGMTASVAVGPVVMNGQKIDSSTAQYPLLVYSNITYVPMTYDLCRFMGLTTDWDESTKTLSIDRSREQGPYVPDTGHPGRKGNVSVTKVTNPVVVCGVPVDNSVASHPLFLYNGVTYFPLTFDYIVNAFGWSYTWDGVAGLDIHVQDRPESPSDDVHTGTPDLDEFLTKLNAFYRMDKHSYSGTLTGPLSGSVQFFTARVETTTNSNYETEVKLTADPFVFFENGRSVSAIYDRYSNLTDEPVFDHDGGWLFSGNIPEGPYINRVPPEDLSSTEMGYLARCFLDCQFSGARTNKIQSYSRTTEGSQTIWNLTVALEECGFTQYDAAITIDGGFITGIGISTGNFKLHMTVTGEQT